MRVVVELPDKEAWALAERAEKRGVKISDLIRAAARDLVRVSSKPRDVIGDLVRVGLPDGEISIRTGLTPASVARHRRALGLPANRRSEYVRVRPAPGPSALMEAA